MMGRHLLFLIALLGAFALLAACDDDEPSSTPPPVPSATATATATSIPLPTATPALAGPAAPASALPPPPTATPQPTPTVAPQPTPTAMAQPTPTATPQPTPTAAPRPTPTAAAQPTPTAAPRPTPSATPRPTPSATPRPTATATPRPTATFTPGSLRVVTGPTRITDSNAVFPAWSPDGAQISFIAREALGATAIHLMNTDGSNRTSLVSTAALGTGLILETAWSPDSAKIAFVSVRDEGSSIFVIDADGNNLQRLTETDAFERQPVWSPDGTKIVFTRTTYASEEDGEGSSDIYLVTVDGSGTIQLTDDPGQDRWPTWLPGGQETAFQSTRDGQDSIYAINIDGSNLRQMARVRLEPLPVGYADYSNIQGQASWSPDSTRVAFHTVEGELAVMNSDGSNRTLLPYGTGLEYYWGAVPAWSPDGTRIAFMYGQAGNFEIYIVDLDGSNLLRLTNSIGDNWFPTWSPDGTMITYTNEQSGIYVVELGTTPE